MPGYRRMLNTKWVDIITNEEVLEKIKENRPNEWHTLRYGELLNDILLSERGKKSGKGRLEYFVQIIKYRNLV